jgi:hypothetical protein
MNVDISGPPLMLRLIKTWRRRKSSFNLGDTSGMPMWLGANEEPMYRPKTASCTARNANAFPGGSTRKTRAANPASRKVMKLISTQRR